MAGSNNDTSFFAAGSNEIEQLVSQVELLRNLECPICTDIPLPPIFLCNNGHSICNSCKEKLTNCGLCHAKFSETRNYFQENIVNASKFKCRYFADGCGEILKGEQQKTHLKCCKFRPIQCNEHGGTKCEGANVPFKDYLAHLRNVHKIVGEGGKDKDSTVFPITCSAPDLNSDRRFPCFYMIFEGKEFLSHVTLKNGIMMWWVSLVDQESEAAKYMAKFLINNTEDHRKIQIEWTFPVHSIRKSQEEIRKSGLCAMLPAAAMAPYLKEKRTGNSIKQVWSTKYTIYKVLSLAD